MAWVFCSGRRLAARSPFLPYSGCCWSIFSPRQAAGQAVWQHGLSSLFVAALTLARLKSRVHLRDSVRRANAVSTASDSASTQSSTASPGAEEWVKGLTVALVARPPPMVRLNSGGTCDSRFIEAVMSRNFIFECILRKRPIPFQSDFQRCRSQIRYTHDSLRDRKA